MYKKLSWIAVVLWMAIIFYMSSQPAVQSGNLSNQITKYSLKAFNKVEPSTKIKKQSLNSVIRKNAHFFIYLGLGVLTVNALRRRGIPGYRCIGFALLICIVYAISDEFHQAFVPGRGPGVKDVFIDSAGALVGILMYLGIKTQVKVFKITASLKK